MYALKTISKNVGVSSYVLGREYHIEPAHDENIVFRVSGEIKSADHEFGFCINRELDAYITTIDGKTVHVVNRADWYKTESDDSR